MFGCRCLHNCVNEVFGLQYVCDVICVLQIRRTGASNPQDSDAVGNPLKSAVSKQGVR